MNIFNNCLVPENFYKPQTTIAFKVPEKPSMHNVRRNFKIYNGFLKSVEKKKKPVSQFCLLIPHTFLYIFDKENKECPKQVINLSFYEFFEKSRGNSQEFFLKSKKYNELPSLHFQVDYEEDLNEWKKYIENGTFSKVSNLNHKYKNTLFINNILLQICFDHLDKDILYELRSLKLLQKQTMDFPEYDTILPSQELVETVKRYEETIQQSINRRKEVKEKCILKDKVKQEEEINFEKQKTKKLEKEINFEKQKNKKLEEEILRLKNEKIILAKELRKCWKKNQKQKNTISRLVNFLQSLKSSK